MDPDPDEHIHPGLESLEWRNDTQGIAPSAKYNKFSESARKVISSESQCAMFCGGKKCKYCTYSSWKKEQMDVDGIYSNWVTDKILAMARPTSKAIEEKKLLEKFKEQGIKAVINLQMPGEHAACGEGLEPSGFSYDPQKFMESGIFFYNFGWNDYGVGSMSTILDIAQVMQFALSEGKIAVHCHAGLGRTGLMIACYLVFTNRMQAGDAVQYVRSRRPKAVQTGEQVRTVSQFEEYLKPFRIIYASKDRSSHEFSLRQFLNRQRHILHGFEGKKLKYLPKIVYVCCERLLELASKGNSLQKTRSTLTISDVQSDILKRTISVSSIAKTGSQVTINSDESHLTLESPTDTARSKSFEDLRNTDYRNILQHENGTNIDKNNDSDKMEEDDDDDDIVCGTVDNKANNSDSDKNDVNNSESAKTLKGADNSASDSDPAMSEVDNASIQGSLFSLESEISKVSLSASSQGSSPEDPAHNIVVTLTEIDYSEEVLKRVDDFESAFNETDETWSIIAQERDPLVVTLLMWNWLDQLSEPVLSAQDLTVLMASGEPPLTALMKVEKGVKLLLEYLARVIIKLRPVSHDLEQSILERLLSHLTHQVVRREILSQPGPESMDDWPKMRSNTTKQLIRFFRRLIRDLKEKEREKKKKQDEEKQ